MNGHCRNVRMLDCSNVPAGNGTVMRTSEWHEVWGLMMDQPVDDDDDVQLMMMGMMKRMMLLLVWMMIMFVVVVVVVMMFERVMVAVGVALVLVLWASLLIHEDARLSRCGGRKRIFCHLLHRPRSIEICAACPPLLLLVPVNNIDFFFFFFHSWYQFFYYYFELKVFLFWCRHEHWQGIVPRAFITFHLIARRFVASCEFYIYMFIWYTHILRETAVSVSQSENTLSYTATTKIVDHLVLA